MINRVNTYTGKYIYILEKNMIKVYSIINNNL